MGGRGGEIFEEVGGMDAVHQGRETRKPHWDGERSQGLNPKKSAEEAGGRNQGISTTSGRRRG